MDGLSNSRRLRLVLIIYSFLFVIALIPIWSFEHPPLQDYPNHMARMFIIGNIRNNLFLQDFYSLRFTVLPNLGMDIIVPILSIFFPLGVAGKLMLSLVLATITGGSLLLNFTFFKTLSFWPLMSFLIFFNEALLKGFINFLFGVGVSLLCLSLWVSLKNRRWQTKVILFNVLSTVIFFCHLYAFCVYAIALCMYELSLLIKNKELSVKDKLGKYTITLVQFIIPVFLNSLSRTPLASAELTYAAIGYKLTHYPYMLLSRYNLLFDGIILFFIVLLIVLYIFIATQDSIEKNRYPLRSPMIYSVLTLIVIYLWIPQNLSTTSSSDWRLLIPLFLLCMSTLPPSFDDWQFKFIASIFCLIFMINVSIVWQNWRDLQPEYQEITQLIENIEEGSRLFPIRGYESYREECYPFIHIPTLAIIQKSAFVPSLLAFPTQQPVRFKEKPIHVIREAPIPTCPRYRESIYQEADWEQVIESYDYILISREELFEEEIPKSSLIKVSEAKNSVLYKTISN